MSETVTIPYGDDRAGVARRLLALAGDRPRLVRTTRSGFVVPAELAERLDASAAPIPTSDPDPGPAEELYDPTAHTVTEVTKYLRAASPPERARVLAAEAASKDRRTIAEWQPAPADTEGE